MKSSSGNKEEERRRGRKRTKEGGKNFSLSPLSLPPLPPFFPIPPPQFYSAFLGDLLGLGGVERLRPGGSTSLGPATKYGLLVGPPVPSSEAAEAAAAPLPLPLASLPSFLLAPAEDPRPSLRGDAAEAAAGGTPPLLVETVATTSGTGG